MPREISFGNFVRQRRREMDLTQEELARRVGCAAITLRKIEADDLRPSVQIAERLAMALAIPLNERAEFVRRARAIQQDAPELPTLTPPPSMDEIGSEDLTGRAIHGYALAERIGKGGMGTVYRAVQPNVEREVAVKIIMPAFANHPDFIRRFEAEAQLVARLEHPHIVPLYDYWREPGVAYLVMRLLRGGNVQNMLGNGPLSLDSTASIFEQICSALNAAHRIGVIHRDLKPANVLLDEDNNAYLADFGIAKNISNPDLENLTLIDQFVGTPQYMSPEQIRSLTVKPQSDIYCLGILLYEMLTGALPFAGPTPIDLIQQHINVPMPPLAAHRNGLPGQLDQVIARATAKNPEERYEDAILFFKEFRQAASGVLDTQPVTIFEDNELIPTNPFKGLRAFGEADAENFFGRETLIQQLLSRLGEGGDLKRFLAVIGPSGSGKSSVVRAGLLPALRRGGLPGSENWYIVDMLPGKHPFEELEASLLRIAVNPPEHLLSQMKDGNRGLLRAIRRILPADESVELVLVIDQFEEVFTLVEDEAERALLLENLATAVLDERSKLRVIITLRADFTDKPLRYVDFGELINNRFEFILPLTPDELERAVVNPTQRVGLKLEQGLVSKIVHDVGNQPGALPLLQYALSELFEKRQGRMLTNTAYQEIGGVLGALGRSAENIYNSLNESEQSAARQLFLRLVTLGEGTEDTRRRVLRDEIESLQGDHQTVMQKVIETFGRSRLLSFDRDPITRGPTLEVAHEAIIREWLRLRSWLEESRTLVRMQRQLSNAASEWMSASRDDSFLLTGTKLAQYEGWTINSAIALTQYEIDFLKAGTTTRDRHEAEEQLRQQREFESVRKLAETESSRAELQEQSARRLRKSAVFLAGALILATFAAIAALLAGNHSSRLADQNKSIASTAQAAEVLAIQERDHADNERYLSTSRELAAASTANLNVDPERSILLALQGLSIKYSSEAENALRSGMAESHITRTITTEGVIQNLAFSPDSKRVAIYQSGLAPEIRDAQTGEVLLSLDTSSEWGVIDFASNGSQVLTFDLEGNFKKWNAQTGKLEDSILITEQELTGVFFFKEQARLVLTGMDRATIYDIENGEKLLTFEGFEMPVTGIALNNDGARMVTIDVNGTANIWDTTSGEKILTFSPDHDQCSYDIKFGKTSDKIFISNTCGRLYVWEIHNGEAKEVFKKAVSLGGGIIFASLNHDETQLIVGGATHRITILNANTFEEETSFPSSEEAIYNGTLSPDGNLYAASLGNNMLKIWKISTPEEIRAPSLPEGQYLTDSVTYSPDGKSMATLLLSENAKLLITDTSSNQEILSINETGICCSLAFTPDGKHIAAAVENGAKIWDVSTGKEILKVSGHDSTVVRIALSPDGRLLATAGRDGLLKVWDMQTGKLERDIKVEDSGWVNEVKFSPNSKLISITSTGPNMAYGTVAIWSTDNGEKLFILGTEKEENIIAWSSEFSPDGGQLAVGYSDNTVRVWDVSQLKAQEQPLFILHGHSDLIWEIDYSPDGNQIATASFDNTAKLWNAMPGADQGKEIATFPGHTGEVNNVSFSPDGKLLATSSWDGTIRIYLVQINDLIIAAKDRVTRLLSLDECQKYLHMEMCPPMP